MLMIKNKKICIIGGLGFLGRNLYSILKANNEVVIIDTIDNYKEKNLQYYNYHNNGFNIFRSQKFDYIFFFSGSASAGRSVKEPIYDLKQNTQILLELLEIIKDTNLKLIFASSAACYGEMNNKIHYPISPYGISKLASEQYLKFYYDTYGLPVLICRYFSLFGEHQIKQVVFDTVFKLLKDSSEVEVYNPNYERDFIYIKEAIQITLSLCESDIFNAVPIDIGRGESYTILELTKIISQILGLDPIYKFRQSESPGVPQKQIANITTLKQNWFNFTNNFQTNLRKTIEWILKNYKGL